MGGNQYAPPGDAATIRQQHCDGVGLVDHSLELLPDPDGLVICEGYPIVLNPLLDYRFEIVEPEVVARDQ